MVLVPVAEGRRKGAVDSAREYLKDNELLNVQSPGTLEGGEYNFQAWE